MTDVDAGEPHVGADVPAGAAGAADAVTVTLPAEGAYLTVLRTATAGLAARLDFTIDEIEDLRIAVDEACAMLLQDAVEGARLHCAFALEGEVMRIAVRVRTQDDRLPSRDTFAWTVLSALAGEVDAVRDSDGDVTLTLAKRRAGRRS